jgi:hypothetical protein
LDAKRKTARSCARPSVISIISQWNIGKKSSDLIETLGKKSRGSGAGGREEEGKTGSKEETGLGMGRLEGKREGLCCNQHDLHLVLAEAVSQNDRDESSAHLLSKEYDEICAMGTRGKRAAVFPGALHHRQ